jgi:hypothetical protein
MLDALDSDGSLDRIYAEKQSPESKAHISELAGACTAKTESAGTEGGF